MLFLRNRLFQATSLVLPTLFFVGCDTLPPLERTPSATPDLIAIRVQCELAEAVLPYLLKHSGHPPPGAKTGLRERNRYSFLKGWTADIDLTLQVQQVSGAAPSVAFVHPMKPAVLPGIGNFSQSFTFGVNAGTTATATRTEQLSFVVNLEDLQKHKRKLPCPQHDYRNLDANLGIAEWLDAALEPVGKEHVFPSAVKPQTKKAPTVQRAAGPSGSGGGASFFTLQLDRERLRNLLDTFKIPEHDPRFAIDPVISPGQTPPETIPESAIFFAVQELMKVINDNAPTGKLPAEMKDFPCPRTATGLFHCYANEYRREDQYLQKPKVLSDSKMKHWAKITENILKELAKIDPGPRDYSQTESPIYRKPYVRYTLEGKTVTIAGANSGATEKVSIITYFRQYFGSVLEAIQSEIERLNPDPRPPLEVIVHQVNFLVTANAAITPNWSLARFRGPNNQSTALLSASRGRTHSLVITIGDPTSDAAKAARTSANLRDALKNSGIIVP